MRQLGLTLGFALAVIAGRLALAGECGCSVQCPQCDHVCKLTCEETKEMKHCWKVECKPICIPRVKFPWEKCCSPPKCAKLKYVRVLKKVECECKSCGYKWEAHCVGGCSKKSCDAGGGKLDAEAPPVPDDSASLNFLRILPVLSAPTAAPNSSKLQRSDANSSKQR